MSVAPGFEAVEGIRAHGFARPEALAWAQAALARWGSLERAAAHTTDALELRGRGTVWAVPAPTGGRWVVRRYRRGGWIAPLLGDRYLRAASSRPEREAAASDEARRLGVPTPRVIAGMTYPNGPVYRCDLVTEYVPDSADLASILFHAANPGADGPAEADFRIACVEEAGRLIVRLASNGVRHRDLNAMNLLVTRHENGTPRVAVLDLDRAEMVGAGGSDPGAMGSRLERSLRKLEQATSRSVREREWQALARGLSVSGRSP